MLNNHKVIFIGIDDVNIDQDTNNNDDVFMEVETLDEADLTTNWADWIPAMLQSKKSSALQILVCDEEGAPDSNLTYTEVEEDRRECL
ncbi:hypothetical protein DMN91_005604 [Ooceraea biroi]|uniref:Uncharacterized protein n=1 Tax=Ooceraea biroi TaxID=2015173 RepID=A0A3L8DLH9_OOCBI|nr:hypothetical protein DMN91_005604 [Ooceraea biroi]